MYKEVNSKIIGGLLEKVKDNDRVIIVYHWNSCSHCRTFMPILHDLLNQERDLLNMSNIFEVEYDNFKYLPRDLTDISAFPMIISYEDGKKKEEFKEQRTSENLKKFIKSNLSKSNNNSTKSNNNSTKSNSNSTKSNSNLTKSNSKSIKKLKNYKIMKIKKNKKE